MTAPADLAARARLVVQIDDAARVVAPLWPLGTFIAVNPLWDLRRLGFERAVATAAGILGIRGYPSTDHFEAAYRAGRVTPSDLLAALAARGCDPPRSAGRPGGHRAPRSDERIPDERVPDERVPDERVPDERVPDERVPDDPGPRRHAATTVGHPGATVDREVAKWCAGFVAGVLPVDPGQGFYPAWRTAVRADPAAGRIAGRAGRRRMSELPGRADDAVVACLERLGIARADRPALLAAELARMPGWAGHAKWRSRWAAPGHPGPALHLVDYLAVRLAYEAELTGAGAGTRPDAPAPAAQRARVQAALAQPTPATLPEEIRRRLDALAPAEAAAVWLEAYEGHYRDALLATLQRPLPPAPGPPAAQAVFCIDTRSEGLRRHLEAAGAYETFGFAGFFALPVRYRAWGSAEAVALCPVLLHPAAEMGDTPLPGGLRAASRELTGLQGMAAAGEAFDAAREGTAAPFVLAEAGGMIAGPVTALRTVAPRWYSAGRSRLRRLLAPPAPVTAAAGPSPQPAGPSPQSAGPSPQPAGPGGGGPAATSPGADATMSDEEQALWAETALTTMGLTSGFAPVVLLCGHGSTTENNPYASALDCGACGGNRGGSSARAAAAILGRTEVRRLLAERGIQIPDATLFVAGEHDTATDEVVIFDPGPAGDDHRERLGSLADALGRARRALSSERVRSLPGAAGADPVRHTAARSADWAQVQPEWGLARNAAFVVGPRSLTAGLDLERRCFLHSYDPAVDPEGAALETILTAPMVVAHWINAQYYFSTVDPEVLSAGDKTVHNVVAGIGVCLGAGGDLRVGLPLQSVFDGPLPYHEPMRLLTVVQAPRERVDAVVARNPLLRELFDGGWVGLAQRDDGTDQWQLRRPGGSWARWDPAGARDVEVIGVG